MFMLPSLKKEGISNNNQIFLIITTKIFRNE